MSFRRVRTGGFLASTLNTGVSLLALAITALALGSAPTWADGGAGGNPSSGIGGVDGNLAGAIGGSGAAGTAGTGAGGGVDLTTGNGAAGGSGGSSTTAGDVNGAAGATGATGRISSTPDFIAQSTTGGIGTVGETAVPGLHRSGGGGGGGAGVSATAKVTITGVGSVKGGDGARPGDGASGGGGGGVGVFSSADLTIEAGGTATGGNGARGGTLSGGGGAGMAVVLTGGGTVQNSGALLGGNGGSTQSQGGGGDGGAGVLLLSGGTVINNAGGTITGGNGGNGRNLPAAGPPIRPGAAGAGIKGANIAIVNAGTISAGTSGTILPTNTPGTIGNAIEFTGGTNALEIWNTSVINGNVLANGADDNFVLGGSANGSFDVTRIGVQYQGFESFEKTGTSLWTLTGTTALTTPWTITRGTLSIADDASLGDVSSALTLNGGTLQVTDSFATSRQLTFVADSNIEVTAGNTMTSSGLIDGAGRFTKTGTGEMIITGNATHTGGTTVSAGTLVVGDGGTNGSLAGNAFVSGTLAFDRSDAVTFAGILTGGGTLEQRGTGTLRLTGGNLISHATINAGSTLIVGNGATAGGFSGDIVNNGTLVYDRSNQVSLTASQQVSGTGRVIKEGSNVLRILGARTYSGGTVIRNGTLWIVNDNTLGAASGGVTMEGGALQFGANATSARHITFASNAAINADLNNPGTATVTVTLSGLIDGAGQFTKTGAGTLIIAGNAAHTGGTVVDGGTLIVGDGGTNGSLAGNVNVANSAEALVFNRSDAVTFAGNITGAGTLEQRGAGTLRLTGGNAISGGTTISAGTLIVGNGGTAGSLGNNVVNNGTLVYDRSDNPAINNTISGTGTVVKAGAGSSQMNGNNSYTGGTIIQSGSLSILADNNLGAASGKVTFQGGSLGIFSTMTMGRHFAFEGDGTINISNGRTLTFTGPTDGAGKFTKIGLGTLVLTGDATHTGGTTITQGKFQIGNGGTTGSLSGNIVNNATLIANRSDDTTLPGAISGTGTLEQIGTGILALSGTNSYAGTTTVTNGTLLVNGNQTGAHGLTTAKIGTSLGGAGTIGGDVLIQTGARLAAGDGTGNVDTLTINGTLTLQVGSNVDYELGQRGVVGGALNDLLAIKGDLNLGGTLNVAAKPGTNFQAGLYRLMNYDGTLTGSTTLGSLPASTVPGSLSLQTVVDHQVNLVNTGGMTFRFWDGETAAANNGAIDGNVGTWKNAAGGDTNWTLDDGSADSAFDGGAFAVFMGTAAAVTVDADSHGAVEAAGMQFVVDGYTVSGGTLTMTPFGGSDSMIRVGDGTANGADITATISSALAGNAQLVKTDAGTLILSGANSYSGGTAINGGVLQIGSDTNLGVAGSGISLDSGTLQNINSISNNRAVTVAAAGGTLDTGANTTLTLNGVVSGSGTLNKSGAGNLIIAGDGSAFTGTTSVTDGMMSVNGQLGGSLDVASGGRLQGRGSVGNTTLASGGIIAPGNSIDTLTIAGNYTGTGGVLEIEAVLGDDASPSDKLVVTGNTDGNTTVKVINVGGTGAATNEGIKIIDVGGTSNSSFALEGDYIFEGQQAVVAGAYGYRLYKNGVSTPADGDWYLRSALLTGESSTPLFQPGAPLYDAYANVLESFNGLDTLQQRTGSRAWTQGVVDTGAVPAAAGQGSGIWGRIVANHLHIDPKSSTASASYDTDTWQLQAGADGLLHGGDAGRLFGGLSARYGTLSADIASPHGDGSINATGYGVGGSLTWQGNTGFYLDAQANLTWYNSDLYATTAAKSLANGVDGFGYALGLEVGQEIALGPNWSLTPQAQLVYSAVDHDDFTDAFGSAVSLLDGNSLKGRLGVSADYQDSWTDSSGQISRIHAYGIANLYYEFLSGSKTSVAGTTLTSEEEPLWGGVGVGGSYSWGDDKYSLHGEASVNTSLGHFGDSYDVTGTIGFKAKF